MQIAAKEAHLVGKVVKLLTILVLYMVNFTAIQIK